MNAREEALLSALDEVLRGIQVLGEAVGRAIVAVNTPVESVMTDETDYESLRNETCTICHRPAYPHPYRHPVSVRVHPRPDPEQGRYVEPGMSSLKQIMENMSRQGQLPFPKDGN